MEHFPLVDRLHTDVLEKRYGKITAKVIKHNNLIRESHLIDKKGISWTYAITFFPKKRNPKILKIDEAIKNGAPIGMAFRSKGYLIRKNVVDVFAVKLSNHLKKEFNTKETFAKARLSEFYARKGKNPPIIYGTVVEIYSPRFRKARINKVDRAQINPTTKQFGKISVTKEEIWDRITQGNKWKNIQEKHERAKKSSLPEVSRLRERISSCLRR
ncbi:MAG: hypothetical protein KJ600_01785 [Nanoarchaeota archaeon]|nr:hypothetical protein [Nanoarchaeota archaeon]MBU1103268.1 hypothetical protein [Nanoarchaeota archaeon]